MDGGAHRARGAMRSRMDVLVLLEIKFMAAVALVVREGIKDYRPSPACAAEWPQLY